MSRTLLTALAAALSLTLAAGCPISQPIIISHPKGAAWSFNYRDAQGEELGQGKASILYSRDGKGLSMVLSEDAFGDQAHLQGEFLRPPTKEQPWVPFRAKGRWFTDEPFHYSGCINPLKARIASGAAAYLQKEQAQLAAHPQIKDPCTPAKGVKKFGQGLMDKVFTWKAGLGVGK